MGKNDLFSDHFVVTNLMTDSASPKIPKKICGFGVRAAIDSFYDHPYTRVGVFFSLGVYTNQNIPFFPINSRCRRNCFSNFLTHLSLCLWRFSIVFTFRHILVYTSREKKNPTIYYVFCKGDLKNCPYITYSYRMEPPFMKMCPGHQLNTCHKGERVALSANYNCVFDAHPKPFFNIRFFSF